MFLAFSIVYTNRCAVQACYLFYQSYQFIPAVFVLTYNFI
jgi:hypothetical protein